MRPPRLAERLLRRRVPPAIQSFLLGDLEERFQALARTSPGRARIWYWRQALLAVITPLPGVLGTGPILPGSGWATDTRLAFRTLRRRPGGSLITVLMLGLGIGLVGAAFSVLWGTVLRGLPFEEADRLVHFERSDHMAGLESMAVTPHDWLAWQESQRSFEALGAFVEATVLIPNDGAPPERVHGIRISANSFPLLRVQPALGRSFSEADEVVGADPVVLLSDRIWARRWGRDPALVGRTVLLGGEPTTVIGVMPAGFGFPISEELWLPLRLDVAAIERGTGRLDVFGRLLPGRDLEAARADFERIASGLGDAFPETNLNVRAELRSFTQEYVGTDFVDTVIRLLAGAFLVLLICCANVANLLLIRGVERRRALAVRRSLGASIADLVRQMLLEAGVLAGLGAIVGVGIAYLGVEWFNRVGTGAGVFDLPHGSDSLFWWNVRLDVPALGVLLGVTVLTALLSGLAPALRVSRTVRTLGSARSDSAGSGAGGLSDALVVGQFVLTGALLVAAGFVSRSVVNVAQAGSGIDARGVVAARIDLPFDPSDAFPETIDRVRFTEEMVMTLVSDPAIVRAAVGTALPLTRPTMAAVLLDTDVPDATRSDVGVVSVSPGYLDLFGVVVSEGRGVETRDRAGTEPIALVNESFVSRHLTGRPALGARLRLGATDGPEPWVTVVGVVPDLWDDPARPERRAGVYLPLAQSGIGDSRVRAGRWGLTAPLFVAEGRGGVVPDASRVRNAAYRVNGSLPVTGVESFSDRADRSLRRYQVWGRFYLAFALTGLLLAALGVYGVLAFSVSLRTGEIGVRRALGASAASVQRGIVAGALRRTLSGGVLGLALGGVLVGGLSRVLYGVETNDPGVYVAVGLLLTVVAVLASWIPARRAARIEPLAAIRSD